MAFAAVLLLNLSCLWVSGSPYMGSHLQGTQLVLAAVQVPAAGGEQQGENWH